MMTKFDLNVIYVCLDSIRLLKFTHFTYVIVKSVQMLNYSLTFINLYFNFLELTIDMMNDVDNDSSGLFKFKFR
jgi:hypothetical protein